MTLDPQEVARELHSACIHLLRRVREVDAESGLSPARLSALSVLVFGGPTTIGGLARVEGVRSPTMTALVTQLEHDGLARRTTPKDRMFDRRHVLVEATPAGARLMKKAQDRRIALLERLMLVGAPGVDDVDLLHRAAELLDAMSGSEL